MTQPCSACAPCDRRIGFYYLLTDIPQEKRKGPPASFQAKKCVVTNDVCLSSVGNNISKMVSNIRRFATQARPRSALSARILMIWQAKGVRHILKDIVEKVVQYVD
ncbi:hypothetical protein TNCV_403231 [Trichonephila clavipes]|nr:hypothetical protein TNCV_403231 [Trichonephila clavipes]